MFGLSRHSGRDKLLIGGFVGAAALGWLCMIFLADKLAGSLFVMLSSFLFVLVTEALRTRKMPISDVMRQGFKFDLRWKTSWGFMERYFRAPSTNSPLSS
jgi:hypothetical protein